MSYEPKRKCRYCLKMKSEIRDFKYFGSPICRDCHCARERQYRIDDPEKVRARECRRRGKYLFYYAAKRAKDKNLPFDLDIEDMNRRVAEGKCEITGLPLAIEGRGQTWNSPSIDRIKPELGYVRSNVRVVIWALNSAFGTWGEGVFAALAERYLERN